MALINKEQEYQDQEAWSNDIQKLKGYKEFKENVDFWATQTDGDHISIIKGPYEIIWDNELGWCVDVDGYASFYRLDIEEIPFQFRNVSNFFDCGYCEKLTSLKNCPIYVGKDFGCAGCKTIISLEGCPKEVRFNFYCYDCGRTFTKEYIQSLCKIKGIVYNGFNQ